jgi:hypothetical protein
MKGHCRELRVCGCTARVRCRAARRSCWEAAAAGSGGCVLQRARVLLGARCGQDAAAADAHAPARQAFAVAVPREPSRSACGAAVARAARLMLHDTTLGMSFCTRILARGTWWQAVQYSRGGPATKQYDCGCGFAPAVCWPTYRAADGLTPDNQAIDGGGPLQAARAAAALSAA